MGEDGTNHLGQINASIFISKARSQRTQTNWVLCEVIRLQVIQLELQIIFPSRPIAKAETTEFK